MSKLKKLTINYGITILAGVVLTIMLCNSLETTPKNMSGDTAIYAIVLKLGSVWL